mgnify:CR=1 FL=1
MTKKLFDREVERIKGDFREVCRTFLNIYAVASTADAAWETSENRTNELLWRRIGQLERQLEAVAPNTGPWYDRSEPIDLTLRRIALWCGLAEESDALNGKVREAEFVHNWD